ncbi:nitrilase/cyanide hydratase and apolipoprotein N-acyltransferase [Flavobacterium limnosediminis JC2902]|uniref:Nitrilase/cyanide hydratase and apolipoprotein N-acyltransferase n=1 Tax=Flavobacterium limnosediminis JC2902 TaxID=1341181 RepID=V6SIM3_9FLAO|nr:carbon-nitrogen hydrolase family protein [Flavobacterium limnosediminis]ESU26122.1 nitrilase/cyanide hydratase and apolipoprotein N-acyltransferase [Flavobacterium limnosediminis JC2902]
MRISIAQTKAVKGNIEANLKAHVDFIKSAVKEKVQLIMFPELSLTGYEPELADQLATTKDDSRLDELQKLSNNENIIICVGLPTKNNNNLFISMIIFQPNKDRITYSKQYLYPTEKGIFTAAQNPYVIHFDGNNSIAPAICYELSNVEHHENAQKNKANIYMASVLNSVGGIKEDIDKLSAIADKYKMTVFMSNYVGESGNYECAGQSSIWNSSGELIAQLDKTNEGQLIYDTETGEIIKKQ